ncbi:hypothetical protein BKA65DRAFT_543050 [Rhexocercosporidium sp. MPI-PUGE-AT-0058]|nr:hypothetical protein BKA65DRAFT_543050 [Rhexocercosporidium sp. MPI-PUGE-AT-0058]
MDEIEATIIGALGPAVASVVGATTTALNISQNRQRLKERLEDKTLLASTFLEIDATFQIQELIDLRASLVTALDRAIYELDVALLTRLNRTPGQETKQIRDCEELQKTTKKFSSRITGADLSLPQRLALCSSANLEEIARVRREDLGGLLELTQEVVDLWVQKDEVHIFPGRGRVMAEGEGGEGGESGDGDRDDRSTRRLSKPAKMALKRAEERKRGR